MHAISYIVKIIKTSVLLCLLFCVKASAKCINVNVNVLPFYYLSLFILFCFIFNIVYLSIML